MKNEWRSLPELPESTHQSAATVLNNILYNIGGRHSNSSVYWFDLLKKDLVWNCMKQVGHFSFKGYRLRDATVLRNQIVYFGEYRETDTYVLQKKENQNELEVDNKLAGMGYMRGSSNSSFCIYKDKIYYFP